MDNNFEKRYKELIEDDRFIEWVKSDKQLHKTYWEEWKRKNPEAVGILKKAVQTVKLLDFKGTQIDPYSISKEWDSVKLQLNSKSNHTTVKQLFFSKIQYAAAVLFIPILLFSAYLIYQNSKLKQENNVIAEAQSGIVHTVEAFPGSKIVVDLPDSSRVWLNSGSKLKYPVRFDQEKREVELTGEGYFEISKSNVPFLVNNVGSTVKVYGTEFNLDTYDESQISLALVEGKVSVLHQNKEYFLKPGQLAEFASNTRRLSINQVELDEYTSWRDGYYIFRGKPLESILRKLKYRYNYEFVIEDQKLAEYRYNAKIRDLGLDQLLHFLTLTGPLEYKIEKTNLEQGVDGIKVRIKRKN